MNQASRQNSKEDCHGGQSETGYRHDYDVMSLTLINVSLLVLCFRGCWSIHGKKLLSLESIALGGVKVQHERRFRGVCLERNYLHIGNGLQRHVDERIFMNIARGKAT